MSSSDEYLKGKRLLLHKSLKGCPKVYLDTLYWNRLRDENLAASSGDKQLLTKLTELVEQGKCILPFSEVSFYEICKQNDLNSLKGCSSVIDKLSKGVSLVSDAERKQLEFKHFLREKTNTPTHDLDELVWTKLSLTILYPLLPRPENMELQFRFIDFLEAISFSDMISMLVSSGNFKPFVHKDNIEALTSGKEKHKHENASFEKMFLSELGGYLEIHEKSLNQSVEQLFGSNPDDSSYRNMIYNLFRLKKVSTEFPSFSIYSTLFAHSRWDSGRKYKDGNNTMDFLHATGALPYYDYFFTEKQLGNDIKQLKLDTKFGCTVESNPTRIMEILDTL